MTETTSEYYIVKVKLKQVKAFDGSILTKEDEEEYLSMSDGYYQIGLSPHKFKTPPSRAKIAEWDGMPWFCRIKSSAVYKVHDRVVKEKKETLVAEYK